MPNGNAFGKFVTASFGTGFGGVVAAKNNGKGKKKGLGNNPKHEDEFVFDTDAGGTGDNVADAMDPSLNQIVDIPFFEPKPKAPEVEEPSAPVVPQESVVEIHNLPVFNDTIMD